MYYIQPKMELRLGRKATPLFAIACVLGAVLNPDAALALNDDSAAASARGLSAAFRSASEKALDAVVAIESSATRTAVSAERSPRGNWPYGDQNPFGGGPWQDLVPPGLKENPGRPRQHGRAGIGSGVIVHRSGLVLTNNHVVEGADKVVVRLRDGREFEALDVKTDPKTDLAVLKIQSDTDLPAARMGDSDSIEVGDWVLALGQPFGLESTVTAGIISAKHRGIGITDRENFLQTDAAINPGNSGGPLVNLDGEVVGINTAISSAGGGNDGIGFAVPINLAKWVARQLATSGMVTRAYLGVGIQSLTADLAEKFRVAPREGVLVNQVHKNTPAEKAGLQSGDVIVEFAGKPISDPRGLQLSVERAEPGVTHQLGIVRDGQRMALSLQPEKQPEKPAPTASRSSQPTLGTLEQLGIGVEEITPSIARQLNLSDVEGVVVTSVETGSAAHRQGLQPGDVVTHVNRQPIVSRATLLSAFDSASLENGVLLTVRNAAGSRFVVLKG